MGDSEWKEVTRKKSQSVFQRLKFPSNNASKVDDLAKISLTVYASNFPSHLTVRELWNICGKAGTLVDVYIANRKNKLGQMFTFCRFIKVSNSESLIASLSNVWIGKLRLHANVARFTTRNMGTGDGIFSGDICRWGKVIKRQKLVIRGTNSRRLIKSKKSKFFPGDMSPGIIS
ncbi:RNA-directed DNA polymerase, eukaryota, partial [Tanacetum coccineum]